MQLNLQTDFALRVLMALAAAERQLSVDDIARRYGISRNHLAKVAQKLQAEGFVETFRGRGGGMRLARPAQQIVVGDVVSRFENLDSYRLSDLVPDRPAFLERLGGVAANVA